ncbi:MAG: CvpA family protein [Planctomycetes bacterium]|nr:CvpA family protein [Planctomycetota bacterium]
MITTFNFLILGLVGLIGYWWATQGVFSALLHLLCVIVAGAIAFAFWEPVTVGFLLRGSSFDNFAWGVSLIGLFVVPLFILRLATNKLVPANVDLPHWANLTFGFPIGVASGVLTMGMVLIGTGFIQSEREIFGYTGTVRDPDQLGKITHVGPSLWLPVHQWTSEFYSWLSVTSLSTGQPLRHNYPDLYKVSGSEFRDSYLGGMGQVTIPPDAATIQGVTICPDLDRCAIRVHFAAEARDFGMQLTLSSAQVRLVSEAHDQSRPYVAHPQTWSQPTKDGSTAVYPFDDSTNYATTVPGQETAIMEFDFPWPPWPNAQTRVPAFIQIKGVRFSLPRLEVVSGPEYEQRLGSSGSVQVSRAAPVSFVGGGQLTTGTDIQITYSIRPISASKNQLPGTIHVNDEGFITDGKGEFKPGGTRPARALRLKGIAESEGTKIVQLTVRRGSASDIFNPGLRQQAGDNAAPMLVDSLGRTYRAIGYIYDRGDSVDLSLTPRRPIRTVAELPQLSPSGGRKLILIFRVTEGVQLVGLRLGDIPVASCNLTVARPG